MKSLFLVLVILLTSFTAKASHSLGASITWKCYSNGQYQFFMELYRDCSLIPWDFKNETLEISGNPLPTNGLSSFIIRPDSVKWLMENRGDLSPKCDSSLGGNFGFSCTNGDDGAVQIFYYKSDSITLQGTPPLQGWQFSWIVPCCRPSDIENVNTAGSILMRAIMYPKAISLSSQCVYSSPQYSEGPETIVCRGTDYFFQGGATSADQGLALIHAWDRPYNPPKNNPIALSYKSGFSPQNPTPDTNFHSNNKASYLDTIGGFVNSRVVSGVGIMKYIYVIRTDAYDKGEKVASVYRDWVISVVDCSPILGNIQNSSPEILLNGAQSNRYEVSVQVGQKLTIPIQARDTNRIGTQQVLQGLTLSTSGAIYTSNFGLDSSCQINGAAPCAYLQNSTPILDTSLTTPAYVIKGIGQVNTELVWQTHCSHLNSDGSSKSYYFNYMVQDDYCPIPGGATGVIKVTVNPISLIKAPHIDCAQKVGSKNNIYWNPSPSQEDGFIGFTVFGSSNRTQGYAQVGETITDSTISFLEDSSSSQINQYYYIEVQSLSCNQDTLTKRSDTIRLITDTLRNLSFTNISNCFLLEWSYQASSSDSLEQKFLIYREFPKGSGYEKIDSVYSTSTYCDVFTSCNDTVSYYVVYSNMNDACNFQSKTVSHVGIKYPVDIGVSLLNGTLTANITNSSYQWYDCIKDSLLDGQVNRTFSPRDTGSYAVIVTQFGCRDTSECIPIYAVGLEENTFQKNISFHPNPTKGLLNIQLNRTYQNLHLQIRNLQGQLVQENQFSNTQELTLDIQARAGLYFVELLNEKGERANLKVIKQ